MIYIPGQSPYVFGLHLVDWLALIGAWTVAVWLYRASGPRSTVERKALSRLKSLKQ